MTYTSACSAGSSSKRPFLRRFRADLGLPALALCLRTASSTCDTAAVVKVQPSKLFSCSCGPCFGALVAPEMPRFFTDFDWIPHRKGLETANGHPVPCGAEVRHELKAFIHQLELRL